MKYAVDQIEGDIVVCENIENGKIVKIYKGDLNFDVCEGDIIKYYGGEYYKDESEKEKRENRIKDKLSRLKRRE